MKCTRKQEERKTQRLHGLTALLEWTEMTRKNIKKTTENITEWRRMIHGEVNPWMQMTEDKTRQAGIGGLLW